MTTAGRDSNHVVVAVDPKTKWIPFDSSGQENTLNVDKHAIKHRVQIQAHDLRVLDPLLSYPSTILRRERAILISLEHIKAIITSEEVLLREPLDDVAPIVEDLRRRLKPHIATGEEDDSPFEFRALEVFLEAICSFFSARTIELETAVYQALDMVISKINSRNLDRLCTLKNQMTTLTARVQKVRDELEQLLDHDDYMADLYLSRKMAGASPVSGSGAASSYRASPTIEKLEMLLEAYFMHIDGSSNKLARLREYIANKEKHIKIEVGNRRNQLIRVELFLNTGSVCLAIFGLVFAFFSTSIPVAWINNNHGDLLKWVVIDGRAFSAIIFVLIVSYARYKRLFFFRD